MGISDKIETFIIELLKEDDGWVELGRNELAAVFNCVPSQINYVISTRFGPDKGYLVESRRGGGGYLKIRRMNHAGAGEAAISIGDVVTQKRAGELLACLEAAGELQHAAAAVMAAGISDKSLAAVPENIRDSLRASILKNMLLASIQ